MNDESSADERTSLLGSALGSMSNIADTLRSTAPSSVKATRVVADSEDSNLPPGTPLYGSSRMAANAIRNEIRRNIDKTPSADDTSVEDPIAAELSSTDLVEEHTLKEIECAGRRTQSTFYEDTVTFAEGSIPQSALIAVVISCVCGAAAYVYYSILEYLLDFIWKDLPELVVVDRWPEEYYFLWIPLVTLTMGLCCSVSIIILGEPGDLAFTIKSLHEKGYKDTRYVIPMAVASMFSMLSGASVGPEAPLVSICAALAGFISRKVFKQKNTNVVRKHTFMGMSGVLSAFFGVPLGGSLFALEVTSRFGVEYFEHSIEAIFAGLICVVVFRSLAGLSLEQIWANSTPTVLEAHPHLILLGGALGLLGGGLAFLFASFHWRLMSFFDWLGLLDDNNARAVPRILLGTFGIIVLGIFVPHTMFWGEDEEPFIASLSPASDLPHVWPTSGMIGFEMDSCLNCVIVGTCKLLAISFSVAGGYRGGFIFPFFLAGAAYGRALCFAFPGLSPTLATLCLAAGINVAITRTALATSLILSYISGDQLALPSILAASVTSLFVTSYMPFIKSQITRSDIDFTLYHKCDPK